MEFRSENKKWGKEGHLTLMKYKIQNRNMSNFML